MVASRKPKSLSDYLVRARFTSGPKDEVKGTWKCNSNRCQICKITECGRNIGVKGICGVSSSFVINLYCFL